MSSPEGLLPTADGPVEDIVAYTDRQAMPAGARLVIAGRFSNLQTAVGPISRNGIALIDAVTNNIETAWHPSSSADAIVAIHAMALSPDGATLYVGGDFSSIGGLSRQNLAAIAMNNGHVVSTWASDTNGPVRSLAVSSDGETLYIGGDFTMVAAMPHAHLAAIDARTGRGIPWQVDADGPVMTLALSNDDSILYTGGSFMRIGGEFHDRLAAIDIAAAAARPGWQADANATVETLVFSGGTLYVGGGFNQLGGQVRNRLAALNPADGSLQAWSPAADGVVRVLVPSANGAVLYAAGDFGQIAGQSRDRIAAVDVSTGQVTGWDPSGVAPPPANAIVAITALAVSDDGRHLYVGGDFSRIGGTDRANLASFRIAPPETTATPPPGAYLVPQSVTLTCLDNKGLACSEIRYTLDGTVPTATSPRYTGAIAIAGPQMTLRYRGLGSEGLWEDVSGGDYFIDATPPVTTNDLQPGRYGSDTIRPIVLDCQDEVDGSGCDATYFTLDGTPPQPPHGRFYLRPIDLAAELVGRGQSFADIDLRFLSVDRAGNSEVEHRAVYHIDLEPPSLTASPPQGGYRKPLTITLDCFDDGGTCGPIYYTLDGSEPSDGQVIGSDGIPPPPTLRYNGPFVLENGAIIKAMARDEAGNVQSGIVGIYVLTEPVRQGGKGTGALGLATLLLLLRRSARWRHSDTTVINAGSDASA